VITVALIGGKIIASSDEPWPPNIMAGARYDTVERTFTIPRALVETICTRLATVSSHIEDEVLDMAEKEAALKLQLEQSAELRSLAFDTQLAARGWKLRPYQRDGIRWLSSRRAGLLCDQMGLGKSIQALGGMPENVGCIIVCPASLRGFWKEEVERWRPDLVPVIIEGKESFRWPATTCGGAKGPSVQNSLRYEVSSPTAGVPARHEGILYECLILSESTFLDSITPPSSPIYLIADECHMFKGDPEHTKRARRMSELCNVIRDSGGWTIGLTGTPLLNEPGELYRVCEVFGVAHEAWGSLPEFRDFFGAYQTKYGIRWSVKEITLEAKERFARVSLRRLQKEVLPELPPLSFREIPIALPSSIRKTLDGLSLDMTEELDRWEFHGVMPGFENYSKVKSELSALKLKAAIEVAGQYEEANEPVLAFSAHRHVIDGLALRVDWSAITGDTPAKKRLFIVDCFQAGTYKGLAMTIQAGGVGFTLTNASHVLMIDCALTPALNAQAITRAWRSGQKNPVLVTYLVADHPLERRIHSILRTKETLLEGL
jgi:SNF2 family DNA or RNA helicase